MSGISFSNVSHGDQRLNVDLSRTTNGVVHLTPPSNAKAFGRVLLNVFTFGIYTYFKDNPKQWNAFRDALAAQYRPGENQSHLPQEYFDQAFASYNTHDRLTQSKANNILAELQAIRRGKVEFPEPSPNPLNPSQALLARGIRSLSERYRDLRENEQALRQQAAAPETKPRNREAVEEVLRPGRTISDVPITRGQAVLRDLAQNHPDRFDFEYTSAGLGRPPLDDLLKNVTRNGGEEIERLKESAADGKTSILSIPFGLTDTSLGPKEDHVVLIAADFKNKKVLYLDSKATPLDLAPQKYANQGDFRAALSGFGTRLFGDDFNPANDILELGTPKQQGANDCGPFTHAFSSYLLNGFSAADIDGAFGVEERAQLRSEFASDILVGNLDDELPWQGIDGYGLAPDEAAAALEADVISLGADEVIPDNVPVGGGQPAAPQLPAVNLDELTPRSNVSTDTVENIRQQFESTTNPVTTRRSVQTQNRVILEETPDSKAIWQSLLAPGSSIPQSLLVESGPSDLALIDRLFEEGYLDRSQGVDTTRSNFEIGGDRVDGDDLLNRVTALANSHGINDERAVRRLYNSLDSQFPHSAPAEFQVFLNKTGNIFTPKLNGPTSFNLRDVRALDPVPGEPGSFILSAKITRPSDVFSIGFNETDEFTFRDFQIPGGGTFRYEGRVQAKITLTNDPAQPPVFKLQFCRSLLSVEQA